MQLEQYEKEHIEIMRRLAPECMVLLKSNGDFPLAAPEKVALYGSGARRTIKGGNGSGNVYSRFYTTIEEGLETAGFSITTKTWMEEYENVYSQARKEFVQDVKRKAKEQHKQALLVAMGAVMPEPEYHLPLNGEGDTAIYVLSRLSGEGSDRKPVKGDLHLSDTEIKDILACRAKYKRFLLVLNIGGIVDLSPVMEVENILLLSQLGAVTGDAFADVVLGKSYPSGKLTATWSRAEDYQKIGDFGNPDDTRYKEGIYVGYRYFNSIGEKPLFPFGYGMGYTSFAVENIAVETAGNEVTVSAAVINTGRRTGKEVLQLYVSAPQGELDKEYQVLAGYGKTKELSGGQQENIQIRFPMGQIASYDTKKAAYVLEQGEYILRLGTDSEHTIVCGVIELEETVTIRQLTNIGGQTDYADWKPETCKRTERIENVPHFVMKKENFEALRFPTAEQIDTQVKDFVKGLSDLELSHICVGSYKGDGSDATVIGSASQKVVGAAGETYSGLKGVPGIVMADGPAGIRILTRYTVDAKGRHALMDELPEGMGDFLPKPLQWVLAFMSRKKPKGQVYYQYCTAIPVGTAIAQSWNLALAEECGDVVGKEMERFGIHLWLAPAFNIQRNPLCGRNFEYYSEDPQLSGQMGAAITKGVQKHKNCGVTVKHYCCNNQETNRPQSNSMVNERALREIYLKPFEICIQEAAPLSLMTSNNLLNGIHTSERSDILKTVLRKEWGYTGLVMTDWMIASTEDKSCRYRYARADMAIKAGNDVYMPGCKTDVQNILTALQGTNPDTRISREEAEFCAYHVVYNAWKLLGKR